MTETQTPVVELVPIADVFCSGISKIEKLGDGLLRIYSYATQGQNCGEGEPERVLVARLVMTAVALSDFAFRAEAAIAGKTAQPSTLALVN